MTTVPSQAEISLIHQVMNKIFINAGRFHKYLNDKEIQHDYGFYPKNYLNISGEQLLQEYPIPVCSFKNGGDIGFNLDGIFFEFFINKDKLLNADFGLFTNTNCRVEVYGSRICMNDFLFKDDTELLFKRRIRESDEKIFGVAFYYTQWLKPEMLFHKFDEKRKNLKIV